MSFTHTLVWWSRLGVCVWKSNTPVCRNNRLVSMWPVFSVTRDIGPLTMTLLWWCSSVKTHRSSHHCRVYRRPLLSHLDAFCNLCLRCFFVFLLGRNKTVCLSFLFASFIRHCRHGQREIITQSHYHPHKKGRSGAASGMDVIMAARHLAAL